jgi:hypothetical protein
MMWQAISARPYHQGAQKLATVTTPFAAASTFETATTAFGTVAAAFETAGSAWRVAADTATAAFEAAAAQGLIDNACHVIIHIIDPRS